jgi:hypothetical protein
MKGRGLILAAAVIQLVGAAFGLLSAISSLVMMPAIMQSVPNAQTGAAAATMMRGVGLGELILVGFTVWVSVKLIQMRRWAWIVSLVMSSLSGALLLFAIFGVLIAGAVGGGHGHGMGVGFGEVIIIFIIGAPVFVVIGLLIGGRSAIGGAAAPRA